MAQNAQPPPLADLMRELSNELIQVQRWAAEQAGLNNTDLMALYFIRSGEGKATPKSVADHLGMTSGATTIMLNRLEARGLVVRSPHPTDRRGILLALGPAAADEAFLNVRKQLFALNAKIFDALPPDEGAIVRKFITNLLTNTRDSLRQIRSADTHEKTDQRH